MTGTASAVYDDPSMTDDARRLWISGSYAVDVFPVDEPRDRSLRFTGLSGVVLPFLFGACVALVGLIIAVLCLFAPGYVVVGALGTALGAMGSRIGSQLFTLRVADPRTLRGPPLLLPPKPAELPDWDEPETRVPDFDEEDTVLDLAPWTESLEPIPMLPDPLEDDACDDHGELDVRVA